MSYYKYGTRDQAFRRAFSSGMKPSRVEQSLTFSFRLDWRGEKRRTSECVVWLSSLFSCWFLSVAPEKPMRYFSSRTSFRLLTKSFISLSFQASNSHHCMLLVHWELDIGRYGVFLEWRKSFWSWKSRGIAGLFLSVAESTHSWFDLSTMRSLLLKYRSFFLSKKREKKKLHNDFKMIFVQRSIQLIQTCSFFFEPID